MCTMCILSFFCSPCDGCFFAPVGAYGDRLHNMQGVFSFRALCGFFRIFTRCGVMDDRAAAGRYRVKRHFFVPI